MDQRVERSHAFETLRSGFGHFQEAFRSIDRFAHIATPRRDSDISIQRNMVS
ncbi:hypothetical protein D3C81_2026360 [compost metagenome]